MIGAVTRRAVAVAVQPVLARQQSIQGVEEVIVGASPDLDDDEPGRGVRHEDREQPAVRPDVGEECAAGRGQVGEAAR